MLISPRKVVPEASFNAAPLKSYLRSIMVNIWFKEHATNYQLIEHECKERYLAQEPFLYIF
jgi:hypothetical protein